MEDNLGLSRKCSRDWESQKYELEKAINKDFKYTFFLEVSFKNWNIKSIVFDARGCPIWDGILIEYPECRKNL